MPQAVRQEMIDGGSSRRYINDNVGRIERMFKWAVENEYVDSGVLQAVAGLKAGRSAARELDPVGPVPEKHVQAIGPMWRTRLRPWSTCNS